MLRKKQPGNNHQTKKNTTLSGATQTGASKMNSDRGRAATKTNIPLTKQAPPATTLTATPTPSTSSTSAAQPPPPPMTPDQAQVTAYNSRRRPTLDHLPADRWWKLFIDSKHHGEAQKTEKPEAFYDNDKSRGYSRAIKDVFDNVLLSDGPHFKRRLDAEYYRFLHEKVTAGVTINEGGKQWSEYEDGRQTSFGSYDWDSWPTGDTYAYGIREADVKAAIEEMRREGLIYTPDDVNIRKLSQEDQDRIGVHLLDSNGTMSAAYRPGEAEKRVKAILERYNKEIKAAKTHDAALAAIARTVRALHVGHFFRDANGRLNIYVVLNKLLTDEGYSPVILPYGPEVFGGMKTIDELVKDIKDGMNDFWDEVDDAYNQERVQ
ncbi:hypothetical protein [Sorangium sp. So ce693]|uniref:hypothetical protein n=1 Tax=Sorangium sp. So ce693 TaxID=3133318 RepID=UPI003F620475